MEKFRSTAEARRQVRVDRICVDGYVEHCRSARECNGGQEKTYLVRKQQYATDTGRIFCVARFEAKTPKLKALIPSKISYLIRRPGTEVRNYRRRMNGLGFRRWQVRRTVFRVRADGVRVSDASVMKKTRMAISGTLCV